VGPWFQQWTTRRWIIDVTLDDAAPEGAGRALVIKVHQQTLAFGIRGRGFTDLTRDVASVVAASGVHTGLCSLLVQHTSASLVIQENADPRRARDLARWLEALAPEGPGYEHDDEGPDDMPGHLRAP
jgi:secondary thiamine-phosphate synthase enzyme